MYVGRVGRFARLRPEFKKMGDERMCQLLRSSLQRFFQGKGYLRAHVIPCVNSRERLSLRALDWLVTNFAKERNVRFRRGTKPFSMYREYRLQLKAYTKRWFDPFQRRERIVFTDGEETFTTTVGQLNFFKWAIQTGVLQYALDNIATIEEHMHAQPKRTPSDKRKPVARFSDPCSSIAGDFVV